MKPVPALQMGWIADPGTAHFPATPNPTCKRRVRSLAVFRSELAHAQVDVVQNKLDTRSLSTSRGLMRRTDILGSLFLRVNSSHSCTHTPPVLWALRNDELHHQPPDAFRRSAPKNTSLASRTGVTSLPDAGALAQPHVCVGTNHSQMVRRLVPVWLFEPAERL